MGIKSTLSVAFSELAVRRIEKWKKDPIKTQQSVFEYLIQKAKSTAFGVDHRFDKIKSYEDFKSNVPYVDYEGLKKYVDRVIAGERNVLWKGKPTYFAKTSGTTSGTKYIPITSESLPFHIRSAQSALLSYIKETKKSKFADGKMIFLQGSPELSKTGSVKTGRLSGIVAHHVPSYLTKTECHL